MVQGFMKGDNKDMIVEAPVRTNTNNFKPGGVQKEFEDEEEGGIYPDVEIKVPKNERFKQI